MDQVSGLATVGSDFLTLDVRRAPGRDKTRWLTAELRAAVLDGRLTRDTRLPPTRALASELGLSRGVVVEAYRRLTEEGLVSARTSAGTTVIGPAAGDGRTRAEVPDPPIAVPDVLPSERLPDVRDRPGVINLSPGVADLAAFPRHRWLRAERDVLDDTVTAQLGYGDPRGSAELRFQLSGWLARTRGVRVDPEGMIIVAGVAQSLALLTHVLQGRGITAVAMEDPGSRGTREQFEYWGMRVVGVPVDADGMRVDAIPVDAGAAILTPAHHFPTGVALAPHRRQAMLDWAADDRLVVEDDYDAEFRYDRSPIPALQGAAPERVVHTASTSKTLAPGIRLGWLVPPPHLLADLVAAKHATDLGSPVLPQLTLARLIANGDYERHLRVVRSRQRVRRDAVASAVAELIDGATVTGLAAGLHLLLRLPDRVSSDAEVAARAEEAGVIVQPLSWHATRSVQPGIVIGYAAHPPDRLRTGIERLARVIQPRWA